MKLSRFILACGLSLSTVVSAIPLFSTPSKAAEETVLVCEGARRYTARVYRRDGALWMRVFDRQNASIWFNGPAAAETNPEVFVWKNAIGQNLSQVSQFRNGATSCSITVGSQPFEQGRVSSVMVLSPVPPTSSEQTILLCDGNLRTTGRVYRSNGKLMIRLFDRRNNSTFLNTEARDVNNPEEYVYASIRGEFGYRISLFRNGSNSCTIVTGNGTERGVARQTPSLTPQ